MHAARRYYAAHVAILLLTLASSVLAQDESVLQAREGVPLWEQMQLLVDAVNERCLATWEGVEPRNYETTECVNGQPINTFIEGSQTNWGVAPLEYVAAYPVLNSTDLVVTGQYTQTWWEVETDGSSNLIERVYDRRGQDWIYTETVSTNPVTCVVSTNRVRGLYLTNFTGSATRPYLDWNLMIEITDKIESLAGYYVDVAATTNAWYYDYAWTNDQAWIWSDDEGWVQLYCDEVMRPRLPGLVPFQSVDLADVFSAEEIGTKLVYTVVHDRGPDAPLAETQLIPGYKVGQPLVHYVPVTNETPRYEITTNTQAYWRYGPSGVHTGFTLARMATVAAGDGGLAPSVELIGFSPSDIDGTYTLDVDHYSGPGGYSIELTDNSSFDDQPWQLLQGTNALFEFRQDGNLFGVLFGDGSSPRGCADSVVGGAYTGGVAFTAGRLELLTDRTSVPLAARDIPQMLLAGYRTEAVVNFPTVTVSSCENTNIVIDFSTVTDPFEVTIIGQAVTGHLASAATWESGTVTDRVWVTGAGSYDLPRTYYDIKSMRASVTDLPMRGLSIRIDGIFDGDAYSRAGTSRRFALEAIDERLKVLRHYTHTPAGIWYTNAVLYEFPRSEHTSYSFTREMAWEEAPAFSPTSIVVAVALGLEYRYPYYARKYLYDSDGDGIADAGFGFGDGWWYQRARLAIRENPYLTGTASIWYYYSPESRWVCDGYTRVFSISGLYHECSDLSRSRGYCGADVAVDQRFVNRFAPWQDFGVGGSSVPTLTDLHDANSVVGLDFSGAWQEAPYDGLGSYTDDVTRGGWAAGTLIPRGTIAWNFEHR